MVALTTHSSRLSRPVSSDCWIIYSTGCASCRIWTAADGAVEGEQHYAHGRGIAKPIELTLRQPDQDSRHVGRRTWLRRSSSRRSARTSRCVS